MPTLSTIRLRMEVIPSALPYTWAAPAKQPPARCQQYLSSKNLELLTAQGALQACQGLKRDVPCSALGAGTKEAPWEGRVVTEKEADLRSPPSGWPARPVFTSSCPHLT